MQILEQEGEEQDVYSCRTETIQRKNFFMDDTKKYTKMSLPIEKKILVGKGRKTYYRKKQFKVEEVHLYLDVWNNSLLKKQIDQQRFEQKKKGDASRKKIYKME